jgi:hypothetical protein
MLVDMLCVVTFVNCLLLAQSSMPARGLVAAQAQAAAGRMQQQAALAATQALQQQSRSRSHLHHQHLVSTDKCILHLSQHNGVNMAVVVHLLHIHSRLGICRVYGDVNAIQSSVLY